MVMKKLNNHRKSTNNFMKITSRFMNETKKLCKKTQKIWKKPLKKTTHSLEIGYIHLFLWQDLWIHAVSIDNSIMHINPIKETISYHIGQTIRLASILNRRTFPLRTLLRIKYYHNIAQRGLEDCSGTSLEA